MNFKKLVIPFLILIAGLVYGYDLTGMQKYLIYENSLTSAADSVVSSWVTIGSSQNVALFYSTDDTSYMKGWVQYRYGSLTGVTTLGADTLSLDNRAGSTSLSKGITLRGYGRTTDAIPGANQIRVIIAWQAVSEATTLGSVYMIAE